jgi:spermidine synthase
LRIVLYLLFLLSAMTAFIYETVWTRYLGPFLGHNTDAQLIVLGVFLGGLAVGACGVARRSERLSEPLVWFARVELALGLIGLVFPWGYGRVAGLAFAHAFPPLADTPFLAVAKWGLIGGLVLPQSILLGTTLPLIGAGVLRRIEQPGQVLASLFFASGFGATLGILVADFWLIDLGGLTGTTQVAAVLNILIAVVSYVLGRGALATRLAVTYVSVRDARRGEGQGLIRPERLWRLLLGVSFAVGVATFLAATSWLRMLLLLFGNTTRAFELTLSAFMLGLALGSLWLRLRADRYANPLRTLGFVQWLVGGTALVSLLVYTAGVDRIAELIAAFRTTDQGYVAFSIARYAFCLAVMLPATFCVGITLPLTTKILIVGGQGERAIGGVYGLNNLGAVTGIVLGSLLLMPLVGLKALLIVGGMGNMALGVLILSRREQPDMATARPALTAGVAAILLVLLVGYGAEFAPVVLASRWNRGDVSPTAQTGEVLFYRHGRTATVAVWRSRDNGSFRMSVNGRPIVSLSAAQRQQRHNPGAPKPFNGDAVVQILLPLMTLAHAPHARQVAVVGHGTGIPSHVLLGSPAVERLVTIEVEPEVIRGSGMLYPANRRVIDDPRAGFVIGDAEWFFASRPTQYDLILSIPSNPLASGVRGRYTTEFYARIAARLNEGGVFGQWLPLAELDDHLVLRILAALHEHFPSYEVFLVDDDNLLMVASTLPRLPAPDWSVLTLPDVAADLEPFMPLTPEELDKTSLLSRHILAPLLDAGVQAHSEWSSGLHFSADKAIYARGSAHGFRALGVGRFDIVAPFLGQRRTFTTRKTVPIPGSSRMIQGALSATLRIGQQEAATTRQEGGEPAYRLWQWKHSLSLEPPPANWRLWFQDALTIEAMLHAGTAGVADEDFYFALRHYVARYGAPIGICHAVRFAEGLARWDFAAAAQAADSLLQDALAGQSWVPVEILRDGAVVAKLVTGDTAGARRYFSALATQSTLQANDLRTRLLNALVTRPMQPVRTPLPNGRVMLICTARGSAP